MERSLKVVLLCFAMCLTVCLGSQAWAISLSFEPSPSTIRAGDFFGLDVVISGLENDDLGTFDFNVNYNADLLDFDRYALGTGLGEIPFEAMDWSLGDLGGGTINLVEMSWLWDLGGQADSFTLATLFFTGSGAGTSPLSFSDVILGNAWGYSLLATSEPGSVEVAPAAAPVPEPATILLLGGGLVGLSGFRRKFGKGELAKG